MVKHSFTIQDERSAVTCGFDMTEGEFTSYCECTTENVCWHRLYVLSGLTELFVDNSSDKKNHQQYVIQNALNFEDGWPMVDAAKKKFRNNDIGNKNKNTSMNTPVKKKWKRWQKITVWTLGSIFLLLVVVAIIAPPVPPTPEELREMEYQKMMQENERRLEQQGKDAEARKKKIDGQFSAWDGSHKKLKEFIKQQLNDPESFENINTTYWDRDSLIAVKTEYTAKNAFGGRVRGVAIAQFDIDGNLIKIISFE